MYRYIYFIDFIIYSFIYSVTLPTLSMFILSCNLFIHVPIYFTYLLYSYIYLFIYLLFAVYIYLWLTVTKASFAPNTWPERRLVGWLLNNELERMWNEVNEA
jgi:hypothetical protein